MEAVLHDKRQQRFRQALTGGQAAHLIAITCGPVPTGHDHWTVRLLESLAVELGNALVDFARNHPPIAQKNETVALATRTVVHPSRRSRIRCGDGGRPGLV